MAEFAALRRTIAGRGTARMVIVPVTCAVWATLALIGASILDVPLMALLSLAPLVGGFEAIHALHVGSERIGRYLQVYYEGLLDGPRWETAVMTVGPALPGGGIDPLFAVVFIGTTVVNLLLFLAPAPPWEEFGLVVVAHVAFLFRIVRARIAAARQRAVELESFKALHSRQQERA